MLRMARSGAVIGTFGLGGRDGRCPKCALPPTAKQAGGVSARERQYLSVRVRQRVLGVARVEELVGVDDHRRDLLSVGVFVEDVKRRWPEARIALARAAKFAVDDRLDGVLLAVDRHD